MSYQSLFLVTNLLYCLDLFTTTFVYHHLSITISFHRNLIYHWWLLIYLLGITGNICGLVGCCNLCDFTYVEYWVIFPVWSVVFSFDFSAVYHFPGAIFWDIVVRELKWISCQIHDHKCSRPQFGADQEKTFLENLWLVVWCW